MRRIRWWHLLDDEDGLGLVEVMAAIFIVGVALLALASVSISSLHSMRVTRDREQAVNAASAAIEEARARDFADLALTPGSVDMSLVPAGDLPATATDACFDDEPVHTDAVVDPLPFHHVAGTQDRVDVFTIVTYAHEDTTVEPDCDDGPSDLKRVTAIATWQDGGVDRSVVQETLVAAAGRGLPVPRFDVRPSEGSLTFSHAYLEDPNITDRHKCVEHQLRNLGAEDSYEWEVLAEAGGATVSLLGSADGYRIGEDWKVTAFIDPDGVGASGGTYPPDGDPLDGAPTRPASDERIVPGESALLSICYEPPDPEEYDPDTDGWPEEITVTAEVYSRFDDRQSGSLTHTVSVQDQAAPGTALFLFDIEDATEHERPVDPHGYLPNEMGPKSPATADESLVSHLGTVDYTDVSKSNWSTEFDPEEHPGVRFNRPTTTDRSIAAPTVGWHHQLLSETTLLPEAYLQVWHAPTNALGDGDDLDDDGQEVTLEVRLDGLKHNENQVIWGGVMTEYTYTHEASDGGGWEELLIPLDLGGEIDFDASEYLRLRVTCSPDNTVDCNVAYDNTDYPSALYVQVK